MTDPNYTVLALCVDRSGSMGPIREDAQGAVNHIVDAQKDVPGRCEVMLCEFGTEWTMVYSLRPVQDTPKYWLTPMGGTALLDAIGNTINELGVQLNRLPEGDRPAHVIVAIQTDGLENSSRFFSEDEVRTMIAHQKQTYSWQFLFLGADLDAIALGGSFGVARGQTMSYSADSTGNTAMGAAVSRYVTDVRSGSTPGSLVEDLP